MKRLSVIGDSPPCAVAVADRVTKPSLEVVAEARLGTELIRSASMEIDRFHPSRVCFERYSGAMSTGSAAAVPGSRTSDPTATTHTATARTPNRHTDQPVHRRVRCATLTACSAKNTAL